MAPELDSWAVVRPFDADDIAALGTKSKASDILFGACDVSGDLARSGAALSNLLGSSLYPSDLLPSLGLLMRRGMLLGPLIRTRRDWHIDKFWPSYKPWIERLETLAGTKPMIHAARRAVANMWICTLEGRSGEPDPAQVRTFLSIYLNTDGSGRWILPGNHNALRGVSHACVAFGMVGAFRRRSAMGDLLQLQSSNPLLKEWFQWHEEHQTERLIGSVTKSENAFKHFIVYLTNNSSVANPTDFFCRAVVRPSLVVRI